jgi:hypothetical protein
MSASMEWLQVLRASLLANRGIAWGVGWNVALLVGSLAAMPFDGRRILGLNPWVKPVKFEISVIVFLLTVGVLLWALGDAPELRVQKLWLGWGVGVAMIVENSVIALQSARGVRSHMNYSTPLDASLFAVMGLFILLNTVCAGWLLVLWMQTSAGLESAVVWGVRLGLLMLLLGSIEGVRMVAHGAHTVGAADGTPGLPFVNWSTRYGDLRIAHFFALHALQIFPLAGIVLAKTRWRDGMQVLVLFVFVVTYSAGVWWLFAEAMRGVPVISASCELRADGSELSS